MAQTNVSLLATELIKQKLLWVPLLSINRKTIHIQRIIKKQFVD